MRSRDKSDDRHARKALSSQVGSQAGAGIDDPLDVILLSNRAPDCTSGPSAKHPACILPAHSTSFKLLELHLSQTLSAHESASPLTHRLLPLNVRCSYASTAYAVTPGTYTNMDASGLPNDKISSMKV